MPLCARHKGTAQQEASHVYTHNGWRAPSVDLGPCCSRVLRDLTPWCHWHLVALGSVQLALQPLLHEAISGLVVQGHGGSARADTGRPQASAARCVPEPPWSAVCIMKLTGKHTWSCEDTSAVASCCLILSFRDTISPCTAQHSRSNQHGLIGTPGQGSGVWEGPCGRCMSQKHGKQAAPDGAHNCYIMRANECPTCLQESGFFKVHGHRDNALILVATLHLPPSSTSCDSTCGHRDSVALQPARLCGC